MKLKHESAPPLQKKEAKSQLDVWKIWANRKKTTRNTWSCLNPTYMSEDQHRNLIVKEETTVSQKETHITNPMKIQME